MMAYLSLLGLTRALQLVITLYLMNEPQEEVNLLVVCGWESV